MRHPLIAAVAFALVACGGPAEPTPLETGNTGNGRLALTAEPDSPSAPVTSTLGVLARISVPNGLAADLSGTLVTFHVVSGDGSVFAGSALTNALGEARERWTLGTVAGLQELEVRAVDQTTGAPIVYTTAKAQGTAGAPVTWNVAPQVANPAVGEAFDFSTATLIGSDAYGNKTPIPGAWTLVRLGYSPGVGWSGDTAPEDCTVSGTLVRCPSSHFGRYLISWDVVLRHETGREVTIQLVVGPW